MPRRVLGIVLFEVSEESIVSEVLEPGGVVGHAVAFSREEEGLVAVAVCALVFAGVVAEVGGWSFAGDGAAINTRHRRGVVTGVH